MHTYASCPAFNHFNNQINCVILKKRCSQKTIYCLHGNDDVLLQWWLPFKCFPSPLPLFLSRIQHSNYWRMHMGVVWIDCVHPTHDVHAWCVWRGRAMSMTSCLDINIWVFFFKKNITINFKIRENDTV
jgi:hypothetical protein